MVIILMVTKIKDNMVAQRAMIRNNLMELINSFIINDTLETFTSAHRI